MAGQIQITPYTRQTNTPSATVQGGDFRVADTSAPFRALEQAGGALMETAIRTSARKDELALMQYEQQLGQLDTQLMIGDDENPGALKRMGVDADDVTANTLGQFDAKTKDLTPQLQTAQAQQRAQQMLATRRQDAQKRLVVHEFDQGRVADDQITTASLTGYRNEAIANADSPEMADAAIARAEGARAAYGRRMGEAPEYTAAKIAEQTSSTVKDVIATQLTRDPANALATFKSNSTRLLGDDLKAVEVAMQPYVLDVQSRAIGDSLYSGTDPAVAVGSASVYDAIALTESGGRQFNDAGQTIMGPVTSNGARAVGQFQIMPGTGPEAAALAGEKWEPARLANDAGYNARLGRAYLDAQIKRFNGNMPVVAAAYNMGPVAAEKWAAGVPYQTQSGKWWHPKAPMDRSAMPSETSAYIDKVTKRMGGMAPRTTPASADSMEGIAAREVDAIRRADQIADPRLRTDTIQRIGFLASNDRKLMQERLRAQELNKAEFTNNFENVQAKLADGVDVPVVERPTEEQLQIAYGPAEGARKYREMNTVAAAAPAISQLKTATVTEAGAVLAQFRPDPKSDNYAFESKLYDGMRTAFVEAQKQRNVDPAQFLLTNSKATATQYASVVAAQQDVLAAKSPEDAKIASENLAKRGQSFTTFMMQEQERLGVPMAQRKLLPVESVTRITGDFDAMVAKGDVQGAANMIRTTVASFGDGSAVAISQLGQSAGPVLRATLEGIDPRTVETFILANGQGDALKKGIGNDAWNETQKAVGQQLAALQATGTSEFPAYLDMTMKVAAQKVTAGFTPQQAAQQAAAETINSRYLFAGRSDKVTYRVPLRTPQGNAIDAQGVVKGADVAIAQLKPTDISVAEAIPPGVPVELYKQYRVERIQRTGQWRTLGDESGLELSYEDDAGRLVPVRNASGLPVRKTWAQLALGKPPPRAGLILPGKL